MNSLIRSSIVLVLVTGWGCTSKPPNPNYSEGVSLVVERHFRKQSTNECEISIGLLNNTWATLNRRTVKYRVFAEGFNSAIIEANYQEDQPIEPGRAGDEKVFKAQTDCSKVFGVQFLKLETSGWLGMTYKPDNYSPMLVDVCEDAENTQYLFRDCKSSIFR